VAIDFDPTTFNSGSALECSAYIADCVKDHEHVVLVGTSCTGIVIPVVTMLRPIDHLVFVCAGLPDIGRSVIDQLNSDGVLHEEWASWDGPRDSAEAARRFMFNDCSGDSLRWSLTTVRAFFPGPAYSEVTPLPLWPQVPSTYVLGTMDRIISQVWARRIVPERLGIGPLELGTGHCPQNSRPELMSRILAGIVAGSNDASA
jgi:pimeloyl-ACP methyl ester carboxylesterase